MKTLKYFKNISEKKNVLLAPMGKILKIVDNSGQLAATFLSKYGQKHKKDQSIIIKD